MVIDSLNLKLRQIARFSSNMILDEMSSAKCHLLFGIFFLIVQHKERPVYHVHMVTLIKQLLSPILLGVGNIIYIRKYRTHSSLKNSLYTHAQFYF